MRKILLGTASVLAASTLFLGSANESHAAAGAALTPGSTDYDLSLVFSPKVTAAGTKAFVIALDAASASTAGSTGIRGFTAGTVGDTAEGITVPKVLDTTANKVGAATNWNVLTNPVYGRLPLVHTPHTTFSAGQWLGVKFLSCGLQEIIRSYTQSTIDPSLYTPTDTVTAIATDSTTFDAGLAAARAAAAATGTTFFTTIVPTMTQALATADASGSAAVYNIYIKPTLATQTPAVAPASQVISHVISCFGITRTTL